MVQKKPRLVRTQMLKLNQRRLRLFKPKKLSSQLNQLKLKLLNKKNPPLHLLQLLQLRKPKTKSKNKPRKKPKSKPKSSLIKRPATSKILSLKLIWNNLKTSPRPTWIIKTRLLKQRKKLPSRLSRFIINNNRLREL